MYYFLYLNAHGDITYKKFKNVAHAVRYRKTFCSNYATIRFDLTKKKLEQSLGVKVDTVEKAEELFDNLYNEAMRATAVKEAEDLAKRFDKIIFQLDKSDMD